jgi:NAD(P)H-hydrate repair Nnr-like enzyme with NAD(P)H-hydrate dehydratase domain
VKGLTLMHAACAAVEAHARAGEAWAKLRGAEAGMLAEELAQLVPGAMEEIRELA